MYLLDISPAEAVANGAQLLDDRVPGWWRMITLEELELEACDMCVCGQIAASAQMRAQLPGPTYFSMLHFLGLKVAYSTADPAVGDYTYGFNTKPSDYFNLEEHEVERAVNETFKALEAEWKKVIVARLEADALDQTEQTIYEPFVQEGLMAPANS